MKNVCLVTTTRAEWGIWRPLAKRLQENSDITLSIVATGSHLVEEFGFTYQEIEQDGFYIDEKIDILLNSDSATAMSISTALALQGFSYYFAHHDFDLILVLGDRFEMMGITLASMHQNIPIAHFCGGEITAGAMDDLNRHAITKMSQLHFTECEIYRQRVIQMGEQPEFVYNIGSLAIDTILNYPMLSRKALAESLEWPTINANAYAIVTFHPETLSTQPIHEQIDCVLQAIEKFPEIHFLITKANADAGGRTLNAALKIYCDKHSHARLFDSLGHRRYLSAVQYAQMVIGNSSSGIIEVPYLGVPTVNIGDRQKGRVRSESVIDCQNHTNEIIEAMQMVQSDLFLQVCNKQEHIYGNGTASEQAEQILQMILEQGIQTKKSFFDIVSLIDE